MREYCYDHSSTFLSSIICFMSVSFSISNEMNCCLLPSLGGESISNDTLRSSESKSSLSSSGSSKNSAILRLPYSIIFAWCNYSNWPTWSIFYWIANFDKLSLAEKNVYFNIPIKQMIPKKISNLVSLLFKLSEKTLLLGFDSVSCIYFFSF